MNVNKLLCIAYISSVVAICSSSVMDNRNVVDNKNVKLVYAEQNTKANSLARVAYNEISLSMLDESKEKEEKYKNILEKKYIKDMERERKEREERERKEREERERKERERKEREERERKEREEREREERERKEREERERKEQEEREEREREERERKEQEEREMEEREEKVTNSIEGISDEDLYILRHILAAEAGDQGLKGIQLVAEVIFNRVDDSNFPNTIKGVVFAPHQFSPIRNGSYYSDYDNNIDDKDRRNIDIAISNVLSGERISDGALYFKMYGYHEGCVPLFKYKSHYFSK